MRRDVTELKKLVHEIMTERAAEGNTHPQTTPVHYIQNALPLIHDTSVVVPTVTEVPATPVSAPPAAKISAPG